MGQSEEAVSAADRGRELVSGWASNAERLFIEASWAESHRDFDTAERRWRELAAVRPDDPDARFELAEALKRRYRDKDAIETYHAVLQRDASYVRPRVELCQLYLRTGEPPLAEEQARAAQASYRSAGNRAGEAQAL